MDRPYDAPEGIRTYLDSLEGLHRLREERRLAGERREFQRGYVALGRFVLTEDGRFGQLVGAAAELGERVPSVLESGAFLRKGREAFGEAWQLTYRTPVALPPPGRTCPECGRGWSTRDAHEATEVHEIRKAWLDEYAGMTYADVQDAFWGERLHAQWDLLEPVPRLYGGAVIAEGAVATFHVTTWFHPECRARQAERDARWWAEEILERAGRPDAAPEVQEVGPRRLDGMYGFRFGTPAGPVRFGRKPPGFFIDWKETGKALPDLFRDPHWLEPPKERGPFHVRPGDERYLVAYLERLLAALGL